MVKHYKEDLKKEQFRQEDKLLAKAQLLAQILRKDFIRDKKKHCLKNNIVYTKSPMNVHQVLTSVSKLTAAKIKQQVQREVAIYKIALENTENVLNQLTQMNVKNQRPADYLVEMYKSDKQMFKVRRYLTQKQSKLKQKMQGKDWQSKTKRKERAKKKAEVKRQRKKAKVQAKRPQFKPNMDKVNGKKKVHK